MKTRAAEYDKEYDLSHLGTNIILPTYKTKHILKCLHVFCVIPPGLYNLSFSV